MKAAPRLRTLCLACLLCCCFAGGCAGRADSGGALPQTEDLPPVPLLPGTGIISHEYQEQEVLPRMTRVASLPRGVAPGQIRTATSVTVPAPARNASPGGQAMTVTASPAASLRPPPSALASARPVPVIHDDIVPPAPEEWRRLAREAEEIFGLDAGLVLAVIQAESSFDHTAISPVGAQGAMQIMPRTQEELGLIDPFDPRANVYAGSQYLMHQLERFGSVELALAAYNAGPASVEQYGGIPPFPETQEFVRRVLLYRERYGAEE